MRVRNSLHAQRAGAVVRSEQHDVADAVGDELDAAQDERAHQDLAQLGVGLHERQQALAVELDHLAGLNPAMRTSDGRPDSMFVSPVNSPARCSTMSLRRLRLDA